MEPKTFKENKKIYIIILASLVMLVGIILRTYNFHDWLVFGPDQARDATLISDALEGKSEPILMGPRAGNTWYFLGPIYYQMEYLSAMLFGNNPDKLAYPDLVFSLLTIPILFFFLKKFFSNLISFSLTALFSVAYFSIQSARFAINSNSLPFFIILFLWSILELMGEENKKKWLWTIILGMSIGVGIQLHTLSFVAMPLIAITCCIYLLIKGKVKWIHLVLAIIFFSLANFSQISYEIKSGGANFKNFIYGARSDGAGGFSAKDVLTTVSCQIESGMSQVTSTGDIKYCREITVKKFKSSKLFMLEFIGGVIFMIGGYIFWFLNILDKRLEGDKKRFLILIMFLNLIFLGLITPVMYQAETHYFNSIFFVSFVCLGLWFEKIEKLNFSLWRKRGVIITLTVIILLFNFYSIGKEFVRYKTGQASNGEFSILGEITPVADFMVKSSNGSSPVYLWGDKDSLHRFSGPLAYLAGKSGLEVAKVQEKKTVIKPGIPFFYIKYSDSNSKTSEIRDIEGYEVEYFQKFGKISIYSLNNSL